MIEKKKSKEKAEKSSEKKVEKEKKEAGEKVEKKVEKKEKTAEVKEKVVKDKKEKVAKKKVVKEKKIVPKVVPSREVKAAREKIKGKAKVKFRGRFGKRTVRRIGKKKWQRWRYPRGKDIRFTKEAGRVPGSGYRTARDIRHRHPSGFYEQYVGNIMDLGRIDKNMFAVRIAAGIGKRKKEAIVKKADALGIKILNR